MGGSDAEGIQRGERAELPQWRLEPDCFANAYKAAKRCSAYPLFLSPADIPLMVS